MCVDLLRRYWSTKTDNSPKEAYRRYRPTADRDETLSFMLPRFINAVLPWQSAVCAGASCRQCTSNGIVARSVSVGSAHVVAGNLPIT